MTVFQSASFAAFRNRHKGETILVCGCGESLNLVRDKAVPITTIGVNDVGRLFDPDYLVVLNQKNQFARGRYTYVENSAARAVFSHYPLRLKKSALVRFELGVYGGTDTDGCSALPYTRNSPYVAVCLAAYMGAGSIGLLGVDFTDHHFFARTGRHPLSAGLEKIDREYQALMLSLREKGISLVNLSQTSRLSSLPKLDLGEFLAASKTSEKRSMQTSSPKSPGANERESTMKVQIEKHRGGLLGDFMDALASTAGALGYTVTRDPVRPGESQAPLRVLWNGRHCRNHKNVIFCEHGWLPREAYQVSPKGINADSHIAPFCWEDTLLPEAQREEVYHYLESLRRQSRFSQEYMRTDAPAVADLPAEFLLVPLQMENDTNIVYHVDSHLRRMQKLIDWLSRANPPYPLVFKQHPADTRRNNGQLRLRIRRGLDRIRSHAQGNIHQILKSGACKGIISLNSNVVHDGFLWDVPAIVLGRNIWPRAGVSPFLHDLPDDWTALARFYSDRRVTACRESYIHFILSNQWTLDDAKTPARVDDLLRAKLRELKSGNVVRFKSTRQPKSTSTRMSVNVVAQNRGWLFEDLKSQFAALRIPGIQIVPSEKPVRQADAWIFPRANEIAVTPDATRTLVQIHDQFAEGYAEGESRYHIRDCAGVCFTHPDQEKIVRAAGVDLENKRVLIKPLGPGRHFQLRQTLARQFTVGWVGRPVIYREHDFKRVAWFCEALAQLDRRENLLAMLLGQRLEETVATLARAGIENAYYPRPKYAHRDYPALYGKMDCVVITSEFAAGPNCLFEALASGVPVITTRCGWSQTLIQQGENGFLAESPAEIARSVDAIRRHREAWFERRSAIRHSVTGLSLERWLEENVRLAVVLAAGEQGSRVLGNFSSF